LIEGTSLVTPAMVERLESAVDEAAAQATLPTEFVMPGQDAVAAPLDVARTVVRRAERLAVGVAADGSQVVPYLNRLSSLLWVLARIEEGSETLPTRPR
jgi:cob(I)alamin adenosyltransferase